MHATFHGGDPARIDAALARLRELLGAAPGWKMTYYDPAPAKPSPGTLAVMGHCDVAIRITWPDCPADG